MKPHGEDAGVQTNSQLPKVRDMSIQADFIDPKLSEQMSKLQSIIKELENKNHLFK
jgi:hypothetical protein